MNPITVITISCLIATVSCANFPRSPRSLQSSPSQLTPQALPAPGSASDAAAKAAAQQAKLHYVEIDPSLKGNYKFGYDTGSGPAGQSFREETRLDDGTVKGAYGYVDANGKQRIVKYTAGKAGFVVEGDQEAPGQGGQAAAPGEPANAQPAEPRRPQPVNLPQQQAAQPQFDEQPHLNRAPAPTAEDRARAEQLHAEQLRQHQLATQAALAQQQKLAQQLQQLQQQQLQAAARQAPQQQQQPQPQQQQPRQQAFSQQPQQQFAAPQPQQLAPQPQFTPQPQQHAAHIVDPQSGSFFSSSNDANLNQLLQNQLRQLQSGNQFAGQFPQPPQQQQPQAQQPSPFAGAQFGAPHQPPTDFNQFRAARQVAQQPQPQHQQFHHQGLAPANALATLHQQHQQDQQMLAQLRAQQLARLQEQARQAPRVGQTLEQPQFQAEPQQQFAASQPQAFAQQPQQRPQVAAQRPQAFAPQPQSSQAAPAVVAQPENFGPPVIDIRTLNYSIGQQTRV